MANPLLDAIAEGVKNGKPLIWLEAEDFGAKVVRNGKPFPWAHPTEFINSYCQLQSLLKPGVVPLNLGNFLRAWLEANPAALTEMGGKKRVRFAIKKLLGLGAPRALIREMVAALCDSVSQPLALVLQSNGDLMNWANQKANHADVAEISEVDVDSVSVYLADFLRTFSGLEVAGVVVQLPEGSALNPQLLELYSPIINVARHYNWAFIVQLVNPSEVNDSEGVVDLLISNHAAADGKLLDDEFWTRGRFEKPERGFYFGEVKASLKPESVLGLLELLKE